MAAPLSATHRGWFYDKENSTLDLYFGTGGASDPTEVLRINASGITNLLAETFNGNLTITDDVLLGLGTGATARLSWDTTDANANALLLQMPAAGAVDVPVLAIGQSIESVDLGLYNGVTEPRVAMFGVGAVTTAPVLEFRKARGTIAAPTVVTSGDDLGTIDFYGAVAAGEYVRGASIRADMAGTIATTRGPGTLTFLTATDAQPSVLTAALTLNADQSATFGAGALITANDGGALGASGTAWSDLFLASGGVINWASGDVTLTHGANELTLGSGDLLVANGFGVIIGHTAQVTTAQANELQLLGTAAADSSMLLGQWAAAATGPAIDFVKSRNAAIGSSTIVNDNDVVGDLNFYADDGTDFANLAAQFRVEVEDASPAANDIGMAFVWSSEGGGAVAYREVMRLSAAGDLTLLAGRTIQSNGAAEMAFCVTNEALTIGSEGTVVIPYLSSTDAAFTDGVGGNLNGAIGIQYDSDTGPTSTLEGRSNGSWVSVALTGTLFPGKREYNAPGHPHYNPNYLVHPAMVFEADGRTWVDESRCFVCGEMMQPGEQAIFYANARRSNGDIHAIYGHPHPERMGYVAGLEERIKKLEAALASKKERSVA